MNTIFVLLLLLLLLLLLQPSCGLSRHQRRARKAALWEAEKATWTKEEIDAALALRQKNEDFGFGLLTVFSGFCLFGILAHSIATGRGRKLVEGDRYQRPFVNA
jgi:hypothetical protein